MTLQNKLIALFLTLLLGFGTGFGVRAYMANHEATVAQLNQTKDANTALTQYATNLKGLADRNHALQLVNTALDTKHTGLLNAKLAENSALRLDLGVAQRMRLQGTSCPKADTGTHTPFASGVVDDPGVFLSAETRLAVWDLRESIVRTEGQVTYLQDYVRKLLEPEAK